MGFWTTFLRARQTQSVWSIDNGYVLKLTPESQLAVLKDDQVLWKMGSSSKRTYSGFGLTMFYMNRFNEPVVSTVNVLKNPERKEYILDTKVQYEQRKDGWLEFSNKNGLSFMSGDGRVLQTYWKPPPVVKETYVRFKHL